MYEIIDRMKDFAKQIGKRNEDSLFIPFWSPESQEDQDQITAHPLGGCPMSDDAHTEQKASGSEMTILQHVLYDHATSNLGVHTF